MSNFRNKAGKIGLFIASSAFHIALLVLAVVLLFWVGKSAYEFGYNVFNDQAMSPGEGKMVEVMIPAGASAYEIGEILESKGVIRDARAFAVLERFSAYHGKLITGKSYSVSTAYKPSMILAQLAGEEGTG